MGTLTLLVPLAVAGGMTFAERRFSLSGLRRNLRRVLRSTTSADATGFYEAVDRADPAGLGTVSQFDVKDPASKRKIVSLGLTLRDIFRLAANHDSICKEWITDYQITFELGYRYFVRELKRTGKLNDATVNTYLNILSQVPDSLIARKAGIQKAKLVSARAKKVLAFGGLSTKKGRKETERLDEALRAKSNLLNPGATADITASVLALVTLSGYRP